MILAARWQKIFIGTKRHEHMASLEMLDSACWSQRLVTTTQRNAAVAMPKKHQGALVEFALRQNLRRGGRVVECT